ncbi:glutaredoxin [Ochrobactrum sp. P20RRXII]|nr:glutaredoxin [Ochrobactrum sp. P20RRXII]NIH77331.1 glutaredoxin [Ochrobactrum sp. P20RRXII]
MSGVKFHILTRENCVYCSRAKRLLKARGIEFEEENHVTEEEIERFKAAGHRTFPRIFKDGELIGGYTELEALLS